MLGRLDNSTLYLEVLIQTQDDGIWNREVGKKLQPSFTSNAKNVVKCASGGGECRYMRHARCYMRVATWDMLMSMYLVLLLHIIHPDHTFPILKTYI